MTAPYRESNDAYTARLVYLRSRRLSQRPGDVLRAQERRQRVREQVAAITWPALDAITRPDDDDQTILVDQAALYALGRELYASRAAVHPTVEEFYASRVSHRFAQKNAWIRVWQDRMGSFQDIALALLIACLLIALWLFVADLASWFMP